VSVEWVEGGSGLLLIFYKPLLYACVCKGYVLNVTNYLISSYFIKIKRSLKNENIRASNVKAHITKPNAEKIERYMSVLGKSIHQDLMITLQDNVMFAQLQFSPSIKNMFVVNYAEYLSQTYIVLYVPLTVLA
jgi:hypothetical protein